MKPKPKKKAAASNRPLKESYNPPLKYPKPPPPPAPPRFHSERKINDFRIETKAIAELTKAPYNPRKISEHDFAALERSIDNWGLVEPIIWNERTQRVVGGHQRLDVLLKCGDKQTDVIVVDLSDEQEKALNLALNRIHGEWEEDKLGDLFKELKAIDFDLELTGFDQSELADFLAEEKEFFTDEDEVPEVTEHICKIGDLWQLGDHRLLCGDATKAEDVVRLMNGERADIVFTDPPYNALKSWNKDEAHSETRLNPNKWFINDNMEWPLYRQFLMKFIMLFSGHSAYICCDYRIYPLVVDAMIKCSWNIKHCIVWKKNVWGLGKRYRFQHEFIVYACNDNAPFFGDRSQSDVWEIASDRTGEHNTPKPVALIELAIRNSTKSCNIVFDSFLGSGTTIIAAEKLGRRCYGLEISPHYCDVIIKRWEDFTGKKAKQIE